jgi:curli biogenesis system outer membrane secretion channel CsgG
VNEKEYNLPKCSKPIASVMVGNMSCKSAACQQGAADVGRSNALMAMAAQMASGQSESTFPAIGDGLKAMLTTAMKETGCFDIQEREAMDELALVGKTVEVQQADFMISGAITSISMSTLKKAVGGGYIPIVGAFSTTKKTADLGMDIKIIDVNKAKVVDSKTFQGNNETSSYSLGGAGFGGGFGLVGGMSNIKGTPMEDIVRDVLARVALFSSMKLIETKGVTDVVITSPIVKKRVGYIVVR